MQGASHSSQLCSQPRGSLTGMCVFRARFLEMEFTDLKLHTLPQGIGDGDDTSQLEVAHKK